MGRLNINRAVFHVKKQPVKASSVYCRRYGWRKLAESGINCYGLRHRFIPLGMVANPTLIALAEQGLFAIPVFDQFKANKQTAASNISRCLAYTIAASSAARAPPVACAATPIRPMDKFASAIPRPRPGLPSTSRAGIRMTQIIGNIQGVGNQYQLDIEVGAELQGCFLSQISIRAFIVKIVENFHCAAQLLV